MENMDSNPEIDLCLSGGGFRAALFHLGSIRRLNEFGLLANLNVISSVSGGSILNGLLASKWSELEIDASGVISNFDEKIAAPMRKFCSTDIRTPVLLGTRLNPFNWKKLASDYFSVSAGYLAERMDTLFQSRHLSNVPPPGNRTPRFVFCATNVRTGACWHFHAGTQGRMGDFYTGYCDSGWVKIGAAVASSAAFPLGFSAYQLKISDEHSLTRIDPWGKEQPISTKRQHEYQAEVSDIHLLTDGGVYDNLGVEPVWKREALLVSDAGSPFASVRANRQFVIPRLLRALDISMAQVGALRKRWLVDQFVTKHKRGALWQIDTILEDFGLPDSKGYSSAIRLLLQGVRTDLNQFSEGEIASLENHGYSLADAAMRSRAKALWPHTSAPFCWPSEKWSNENETGIAEILCKSGDRRILEGIGSYLFGRNESYM